MRKLPKAKRQGIVAVALLVGMSMLGQGCMSWGGTVTSYGQVPDPREDTSFVKSKEMILVMNRAGLQRVRLDGKQYALLHPVFGKFVGTSADQRRYLFLDRKGVLFLVEGSVPRLRKIAQNITYAALAPNGQQVALLDSRARSVTILSLGDKRVKHIQLKVGLAWDYIYWSDHGDVIKVSSTDRRTHKDTVFLIEPASKAVKKAPQKLALKESRRFVSRYVSSQQARRGCPLQLEYIVDAMGPGGLRLKTRTGQRTLFVLEGRYAGYQRLGPSHTIGLRTITRDCRHVLFSFKNTIYLLELSSGKIGRLAIGDAWRAPLP